ncbi:MAG TPA: PQQ-dependent dehydrogenase, methanol/ethanol family, partial [Gemmatimonadaceae bacterium]|nr:PQQ-dependent dehydrogenase, methanol/ethanol family [Gemmatimonadaceae bacterium]
MRCRASVGVVAVVGVIAASSLLVAGCRSSSSSAGGATRDTAYVVGAKIGVAPPDGVKDGEWSLPARDYASSRFSNLSQITPDNARNLHVAWTFSTGVLRGHEGQPLVVDNTMYMITPYPNVAYAIDLTQPGFPLKWKYRPENAQAAVGVACCDVVNRGATFADGRIVYNLLDGHTVAVDAATGTELWRVKMADLDRGETITMAPIVVKGKVIVGSSGGEMGVRGWIAALDLGSGKEVWRAYSVGPDADMKCCAKFKPFYPQDRGANLGVSTWPGDSWKVGGAAVWGWVSYDPALNLLYHGTSNPGPWNGNQRPGDNKWTAAIIARDADSGEMVWAFQPTPHDIWDYDAVNENILVDLPFNGRTRKVLEHFDRNGFAYMIDRATGEVLSAKPFVPMNWASGVDPKTGRPILLPNAEPQVKPYLISPGSGGGHNWNPMSYSPLTGLVYIPMMEGYMVESVVEDDQFKFTLGRTTINQGYANEPELRKKLRQEAADREKGYLLAWDPAKNKEAFRIPYPHAGNGGTMTTAGNLLVEGTINKTFAIYRADN